MQQEKLARQLEALNLGSLTYGKAEFTMRAKGKADLPPFLGSTIRGALGHALRKIACLPLCRDPRDCILRERCAYAYCFETHVPKNSSVLRNLEHVPHPLVLEPPPMRSGGTWAEGEELRFSVLLVGKAISYFPYFVAAVDRMASAGFGKDRNQFQLIEVREASEPSLELNSLPPLWSGPNSKIHALRARSPIKMPLPAVDEGELEFLTPLRLIVNGKPCIDLRFRDLVRALLSRLSSLMYFHCRQEIETEFNEILDAAEQIDVKERDLHTQQLQRWSNRQKASIRLDGMVGKVRFSGRNLPLFMELLGAGEIFHVGKGTIFGLGKYKLTLSERKLHNG